MIPLPSAIEIASGEPLLQLLLEALADGISADIREAMKTLLEETPQPVQVGLVNGRAFLVNASVGLYPQLLEDRESWKQRIGRSRLVALGAGIATLLKGHRSLRLRFDARDAPDAPQELRTPTLFVGNNALQMEQVGLPESRAIDQGRLAGVALKPVGRWALLGLLLRGATLGYPIIHIDEQFYLLVGDRMLHGAVPFVDIWDRKPIGLFLIYAATRLLPASTCPPCVSYSMAPSRSPPRCAENSSARWRPAGSSPARCFRCTASPKRASRQRFPHPNPAIRRSPSNATRLQSVQRSKPQPRQIRKRIPSSSSALQSRDAKSGLQTTHGRK